jgi:hypothetical protein
MQGLSSWIVKLFSIQHFSECLEGATVPNNICPQGFYCPGYLDTSTSKVHCPKGTYSYAEGITSQAECNMCEAGFYCPQDESELTLANLNQHQQIEVSRFSNFG